MLGHALPEELVDACRQRIVRYGVGGEWVVVYVYVCYIYVYGGGVGGWAMVVVGDAVWSMFCYG